MSFEYLLINSMKHLCNYSSCKSFLIRTRGEVLYFLTSKVVKIRRNSHSDSLLCNVVFPGSVIKVFSCFFLVFPTVNLVENDCVHVFGVRCNTLEMTSVGSC